MAALIPGLLAAAFYIGVIAWLVRRNPAAGPAGPKLTAIERRAALLRVWPVLLIAVAVVGGIYGGVFTPTEGAAVGVVAMLVWARRRARSAPPPSPTACARPPRPRR